jgi:hypothetical protein
MSYRAEFIRQQRRTRSAASAFLIINKTPAFEEEKNVPHRSTASRLSIQRRRS